MADKAPTRPLTAEEIAAVQHLFDRISAAEEGNGEDKPRAALLRLWAECATAVTGQVPVPVRESPFLSDLDDDAPF